MDPQTQGILVLAALFAVELFGILVVFPEWKNRREQRHQKNQNPDADAHQDHES